MEIKKYIEKRPDKSRQAYERIDFFKNKNFMEGNDHTVPCVSLNFIKMVYNLNLKGNKKMSDKYVIAA